MFAREDLTSRRWFLGRSLGFAALAALTPGLSLAAASRPPLEFRRLADGVWMHLSWLGGPGDYYSSNGLVVFGGDHVLLVDTPWTVAYTQELLGRIIGATDIQLVVTHAHDDRMGGIDVTKAAGIPSLAYAATARAAAAKDLGVIDHVWAGPLHRLDVGGRKIELFYPGPGHTPDNTVVYIEDCKLLFGGCMVRPLRATQLGGLQSADVCRWGASIKALQQRYKKARIVVPGHWEAGGFDLLTHTATLVEAERAKVNCA